MGYVNHDNFRRNDLHNHVSAKDKPHVIGHFQIKIKLQTKETERNDANEEIQDEKNVKIS